MHECLAAFLFLKSNELQQKNEDDFYALYARPAPRWFLILCQCLPLLQRKKGAVQGALDPVRQNEADGLTPLCESPAPSVPGRCGPVRPIA